MRKNNTNVLLLLGRYNPAFHRGIAHYAGEHGWHLCSEMADRGKIPYGWRGNGIITSLGNRPEILRFIRRASVPVVDLIMQQPEIRLPRVTGDNVAIGRVGAEHFLERGFRHYAWYSEEYTPLERLRFQGFEDHLQREGFHAVRLVWQHARKRVSTSTWRAQRLWLARALKTSPKPLGILAFSDYDAATVLDACTLQGLRVPDDVAVLGVNNSELVCDFLPIPLSSINHDMERVGYEGAALLNRLMKGDRPPKRPILIPPRGVTLRQSTDILAVNHPTLRTALLFFKSHYQESIGTPEAAAAAGLKRQTLERLFRTHLNRTVHSELLRIRLRHATDLLETTTLPASSIAQQTGFCHPSHFNNAFRRLTGTTPRQYRLKLGGGKGVLAI